MTSLDRRIAQIYPMQVWRENEKFFETYRDHPGMARSIAFNAADLAPMRDGLARPRAVPARAAARIGIENRQVRLFAYKGRIEVLSEAIYQERKRQATEVAEEDLETAGAGGAEVDAPCTSLSCSPKRIELSGGSSRRESIWMRRRDWAGTRGRSPAA